MDDVEILATQVGPRGEVRLQRRTRGQEPPIEELIVNGVFAMDSSDPFSERALGAIALSVARGDGPIRVLVGGLGLGYTVREIIESADQETIDVSVDVVEIEGALIAWARAGVTATLGRVAADPRVRLYPADIGSVLVGRRQGPVGPWDAILLDVDNGPDFLIHGSNADLYAETGLRAAYARLAPGGIIAVWCQGPSDALLEVLSRIDPHPRENSFEVRRGERLFEYVIYVVTRL